MLDLRKLVKYPADLLYKLENGMADERHADKLVPSMEPLATDKFVNMQTIMYFNGVELILRFDEVILKEGVTYLIVNRRERSKSKDAHHYKGLIQTALLGYLLESGPEVEDILLATSPEAVEAGYQKKSISLVTTKIAYILRYEDVTYDVIADACVVSWLEDKIDCFLGSLKACEGFESMSDLKKVAARLDVVEML